MFASSLPSSCVKRLLPTTPRPSRTSRPSATRCSPSLAPRLVYSLLIMLCCHEMSPCTCCRRLHCAYSADTLHEYAGFRCCSERAARLLQYYICTTKVMDCVYRAHCAHAVSGYADTIDGSALCMALPTAYCYVFTPTVVRLGFAQRALSRARSSQRSRAAAN